MPALSVSASREDVPEGGAVTDGLIEVQLGTDLGHEVELLLGALPISIAF